MLQLLLFTACARADPPDVVLHQGKVDVVVCDGSGYGVPIVRRAMRWWHERCVFDELGWVRHGACPDFPTLDDPLVLARPNTIYLLGSAPLPRHAGSTLTLYGPAGPISLIRFDDEYAAARAPASFPLRWRLLLHELGHALAFDDDSNNHGPKGTVMAGAIDTMGPSDHGLNQCLR